jgi:hypothetical protein
VRSKVGVCLVAIALVLLGTPASAQGEFTGISFGGVSFAFGPELGASANATRVPEQPTEPEQTPFAPDAAHLTFTLYGPVPEFQRPPRVGDSRSVVRAYRIADFEGYEFASAQLDALRTLLEDRPSLDPFMDFSDLDGEPLPHMPADVGAAQSLRARATYIETPELAGIAYIVGYRQDVFPFAAEDFWYSFQALSNDGQWYVAGDLVVEASMFPQRVRPRDAEGFRRQARWRAYLQESVESLNDASPDAFSPPLTSIDVLIQSITFTPTIEGEPGDA